VWYNEEIDAETFFDAKLLKMTSVLASMTTAFFNRNLADYLPEKADKVPLFDARVYNVPTDWEATNYLIWREMDATRNSVSMAAQSKFSHNQLQNKSSSEMQEMMFQLDGTNWNNYPNFFKRGTYLARQKTRRPFTTDELDKLPKMHAARRDPNLMVERQDVVTLELPPLRKVANREAVIFDGAAVILKTEAETTQEE
jgi:tRNA(His) guanylyltransferase